MMRMNWFVWSSPAAFYPWAGRLAGVFAVMAALLAIAGLWVGLFVAPTDAVQGEAYRIIFIHVPAAWMAMFTYLVMAAWLAYLKSRLLLPEAPKVPEPAAASYADCLAACASASLAPQATLAPPVAAALLALWFLPRFCTFAHAASAEKHAFATRFVVTSSAFKSPSSAAEDAYVFAVERAVPKGVRALCLSDLHRSA